MMKRKKLKELTDKEYIEGFLKDRRAYKWIMKIFTIFIVGLSLYYVDITISYIFSSPVEASIYHIERGRKSKISTHILHYNFIDTSLPPPVDSVEISSYIYRSNIEEKKLLLSLSPLTWGVYPFYWKYFLEETVFFILTLSLYLYARKLYRKGERLAPKPQKLAEVKEPLSRHFKDKG